MRISDHYQLRSSTRGLERTGIEATERMCLLPRRSDVPFVPSLYPVTTLKPNSCPGAGRRAQCFEA